MILIHVFLLLRLFCTSSNMLVQLVIFIGRMPGLSPLAPSQASQAKVGPPGFLPPGAFIGAAGEVGDIGQ